MLEPSSGIHAHFMTTGLSSANIHEMSPVELRTIVAAMDDSEIGRRAAAAAADLAARVGARLTILTVLPPSGPAGATPEWLLREVRRLEPRIKARPDVVVGLPGVEIPRYAEEQAADLIVMGRSHRTPAERMLVGDIADAVARRSSVPCLFVPQAVPTVTRILAAVDGTERGFGVLIAAVDFAEALKGRLRVLTVEPERLDDEAAGVAHLPDGRSARLSQAVDRLRVEQPLPWASWESAPGADRATALVVRRGNAATEILAEVATANPDVLVFGYRRGGPPGMLEGRSVGRRVAHACPCATLTIPL
jgi:nucleotide-binding universal stress UspA family protein